MKNEFHFINNNVKRTKSQTRMFFSVAASVIFLTEGFILMQWRKWDLSYSYIRFQRIFLKTMQVLVEKVLDLSVRVDDEHDDGKHNNKIVLCNHVGYMDVPVLMWYHAKRFPNHKMVWVAKSDVSHIPVIGEHMTQEHILLHRDIQKDLSVIHNYRHNLRDTKTPYVIYLFPEGTTRCVSTMKRSKENSILHWNNLLTPKCGALYELMPLVEGVLSLTLIYDGVGTAESPKGVFYGDYPQSVLIHVSDVSNRFMPLLTFADVKSAMLELWDAKDRMLDEHEYSLARFRNHHCPMDKLMPFHTGMLFLHSILSLVFLGKRAFWISLSTSIMAVESHHWQRHKLLNAWMEMIYIAYFFYISGELSQWLLILGLCCCIVGTLGSVFFLEVYGRALCCMAPLIVMMEHKLLA